MWLLAANRISIDFPTFLGNTSPRQVNKSTLMPVAACSHRHQHIFPYSSGRCIAQTSRQINANAFGCMQPQASAWMSVLFWAMHRPEKWGNLCRRLRQHVDACGGMQPHATAYVSLLFWAMHRPEQVRKSTPMHVVARPHTLA